MSTPSSLVQRGYTLLPRLRRWNAPLTPEPGVPTTQTGFIGLRSISGSRIIRWPTAIGKSDMSQFDFEQFRELVLIDPTLQSQLRDIADLEIFLSTALALADRYGLHITRDDIETAIRASRRTLQTEGLV
jgi:hypothetical protein